MRHLLYIGHCLRASLALIYVALAEAYEVDTVSVILILARETEAQSGAAKMIQTIAVWLPCPCSWPLCCAPSVVMKLSLGEAALVGPPL